MNKLRTMALLLWVALLCPYARGQHNCSFDADQDSLIAHDSSYYWKYHEHANYVNWFRQNNQNTKTVIPGGQSLQSLQPGCRNTTYVLPVVFHVMYDPSIPATNVADSLILKQLEILNDAYANARGSTHPKAVNTEIQFCLAQRKPDGTSFNGINHISYTGTNVQLNDAQKNTLASNVYYDNERYINIWVVKDITAPNGTSLNKGGYSNINYQLGVVDGIVIRYDFLGNYDSCNSCFHSASRGLSLVHELGHYFGLYHTFHKGCAAGTDSTNCAKAGDLCCDTRPCNQTFDCPTGTTQPDCPNLPFYAGQDDNRKNYMSYADEDCKDNFTKGQAEIMTAVLMSKRRGLIDPNNTNALALSCCKATPWFSASNTFLCAADSVRFVAVDQSGVTYNWRIINSATSAIIKDTILSTNKFNYFFGTQGKYNITLRIIGGIDTPTQVRNNFVEYANCGSTIANTQGNWYFGKYGGLNFKSVGPIFDVTPSRLPRTIKSQEGAITHSDNNGNLLFYGGGDSLSNPYFRIYKPVIGGHAEVNTSNLLIGHSSSSQGGIVLPFDSDTNKYRLIVTGGAVGTGTERISEGARQSVIDKTTTNLVTSFANRKINPPPGASPASGDSTVDCNEIVTAIPRCGGGYWLILQDFDPSSPTKDKLIIYLANDAGITYHGVSDVRVSGSYFGQLKASPNGNFLACPGHIFRFDPKNGTATLMKRYNTDPYSSDYYGSSFSPKSEILYVTEVVYFPEYKTKLIQFDLLASNDSLSRREIDLPLYVEYLNAIQLGPDNKIYMSVAGVPQLAVINYPDSLNSTASPNKCGFEIQGPMLQNSAGEGGTCGYGLPNMMDALPPSKFALDFYHVDSNCRIVNFFPNKYCDSVKKWYFGDGDSSTSQTPVHTYSLNDSFKVKMVLANGDSVVKKIRVGFDNPIIEGDTFISCDTLAQHVYVVTNQKDNLVYTWSAFSGTITDVNNAFNAYIIWGGVGNKAVVEAADPRTGCKAYDTLVIYRGATPESDTLWMNSPPCTKSSPVVIRSHQYSNTTYQWYYSTDSVNWTAISGATADTLNYTLNADSLYFKRRVSQNDSSCYFLSSPVKVKPQIYIQRQPQDDVVCPGGERKFSIGVVALPGVTVSYTWQYQFKGSSQWSAQFYTGDSISDWPTGTVYDSAKFRCTVTASCGSIISDTAYVLIEKSPDITGQPQNQTVTEGDSAIFTVSTIALKPQYTWYYNRNGAQKWDSIPGEHNDTLIVHTVSSCDNKNRYRVVTNACGSTSNPATLTVVSPIELWSKDGARDTSQEPNNVDPYNDYWGSPDLWNCATSSGCATHQTPEYKQMANAWNWAKAKVRNKGTAASDSFQLKLYWTLGGFYERWPISWHYDLVNNGFFDGTNTYAMGQEIGTYNHPPLAAGDSSVIVFEWAPPYAGWYNTSPHFVGSRVAHPLCMLSRILTCPDTPFGMTYPEIEATGENVKNNNNIVTRNTEIFDSISGNKTTPEWVLRMGNQWPETKKIRLTLQNDVTNFWDLGYTVLYLEPEIYEAWENGGSVGYGYTLVDSVFYIDGDGFYLENIELPAGEWGWAHFQFRIYDSLEITEDRGQQLFRFVQSAYNTEASTYIADGGFNFLLNLLPPPPPHVDSLDFTISPNPTTPGNVLVSWTSNFSASGVTLDVFDGLGNPVISQVSIGSISPGNQSTLVNLSGVSSGTYTMTINANGNNYSEIVVVF